MAFAPQNSDLSYWRKQTREQPLFPDLVWNIPEQKSGNVVVLGGNSQGFSTPLRIAEFLDRNFPIASLKLLLPDALRGKLPPLSNIELLPSTVSGSFDKSYRLKDFLAQASASLVIGDLSKNSATAVALASAIAPSDDLDNSTSEKSADTKRPSPIVITRDSVDLLATEASNWLLRDNIFIVASMAQLQKLFRAIYYPRMILLSQPLLPAIETLHKFTLTYPVTILTYHQDNIIVAAGGEITSTPILVTEYSPISLWSGQLAAKTLMLNLYNPGKNLAASTAAILY